MPAPVPTRSRLRPLRHSRHWLALWSLALAATVLVGLLPLPASGADLPGLDKLAHLLGYAALAGSAAMLFEPRRGLPLAATGLLALGVVIELLQGLLPWRSAELLDLLANAAGVALGSLLATTPLARSLFALERRLPGGDADAPSRGPPTRPG